MAIHLPRQRDSFGVPARYTDLKSAGLLYTPPGEWRYDSYDVDGDVATLYAENVDLADYLYNADHGNAVVLPDGASAVATGGGWAIFTGKLYYKRADTGTWVDTGLGTDFTSVAGYIHPDNFFTTNTVIACQNGQLCEVGVFTPSYTFYKNNAQGTYNDEWLTVNAVATSGYYAFTGNYVPIFGTSVNGYAMKGHFESGIIYSDSKLLSLYTNVQVAGTEVEWTYQELPVAWCNGLLLNKDTDTIYTLTGAALSLGTGWTAISGHARTVIITSDVPYDYTRMYGIKDGNLYSLSKSGSSSTNWTATLVDDSGDWYMVQFIGPDVAVAIRRVNTAGGGGSGTIDPLGDVIVSGTSTGLDGTYTLISGTGESRQWRRDDGQYRYEIAYYGGYWYIHSSYDEMGNGEYMMHFDECRGAGTDPWAAAWETSWEDEWQNTAGNQGTVPTVTGTEA